MIVVVDSSLIVDALLRGAQAVAIHSTLINEDVHAPVLLDYEVVSSLRGWSRSGRLPETRLTEALNDFDDLPIQRWAPTHELRQRAFQLRDAVTAYDAAYVALAEALECPLLTQDRRLGGSTGHHARIRLV